MFLITHGTEWPKLNINISSSFQHYSRMQHGNRVLISARNISV